MLRRNSCLRVRRTRIRVWCKADLPGERHCERRQRGRSVGFSSASSRTMAADFPPSSSVTLVSRSAQVLAITFPAAVLPVKLTLSTSTLATRCAPPSASAVIAFSTPGGRPASLRIARQQVHRTVFLGRLDHNCASGSQCARPAYRRGGVVARSTARSAQQRRLVAG